MQVRLNALSIVLGLLVIGCAPEQKCNGVLFYDPSAFACRPCPMGATFKNGTCECKEQYEFVSNRCVLMDGAVTESPDAGASADAGAGAPAAASCTDYCDFAKSCIADNGLAKSALPDVVSGLHADDAAMCTSSCKSDLGGDGASDPVVACIKTGQTSMPCAGDSSQTGLVNAFGVLGECCKAHKDNALCMSICKPLKANPLTSAMIDFCM